MAAWKCMFRGWRPRWRRVASTARSDSWSAGGTRRRTTSPPSPNGSRPTTKRPSPSRLGAGISILSSCTKWTASDLSSTCPRGSRSSATSTITTSSVPAGTSTTHPTPLSATGRPEPSASSTRASSRGGDASSVLNPHCASFPNWPTTAGFQRYWSVRTGCAGRCSTTDSILSGFS